MKRKLLSGITVLFMIIAVIFTACPGDDSGGSGGGGGSNNGSSNGGGGGGGGGGQIEPPDPTLPPIDTNQGGEELPPYIDPEDPDAPPVPRPPNGTLQDDDLVLSVNTPGLTQIRWQWYRNNVDSYDYDITVVNEFGAMGPIPGENKKEYNPPTNVPGTMYYWVSIDLEDGRTVKSQRKEVVVLPKEGISAVVPNFTVQPVGAMYSKDSDQVVALTFTAETPDTGTLRYQWYINDKPSNEGGTALTGEGNSGGPKTLNISGKYTPTVTEPGWYYYYVEVSNTITTNPNDGGIKKRTAKSNVAAIQVKKSVSAKMPTITKHPNATPNPAPATWKGGGYIYTQGNAAVPLTITATPPGDSSIPLSYQWYWSRGNVNEYGTPIEGATETSYTPPTNRGFSDEDLYQTVYFYFCEVTNTLPDMDDDTIVEKKTASVRSNVVYIGIGLIPVTLSGLAAQTKTYDGNMIAVIQGTPRNGNSTAQFPWGEADVHFEGFEWVNNSHGTSILPGEIKTPGKFKTPNVGTSIEVEFQGLKLAGEDAKNYYLILPKLTASINKAAGGAVTPPIQTAQKAGDQVRGRTITLTGDSRVVDLSESPTATDAQKNLNNLQRQQQTVIEYQAGTKPLTTGNTTGLVGSPVTSTKVAGLGFTKDRPSNQNYDGYYIFARSKATDNFNAGAWSIAGTTEGTWTLPGAKVSVPAVAKTSDNTDDVTDSSITMNVSAILPLVGDDYPGYLPKWGWTGVVTNQTIQYAISTNSGLISTTTANGLTAVASSLVWVTSTTSTTVKFTGLDTNTTYYVYARSAENADYETGTTVVRSAAITTGNPKISFNTDSVPMSTKTWVKGTVFANNLTNIPTMAKADYVFEGWYVDQNKTIPYNFANPVVKSFTLYARWTHVNEIDRMATKTYGGIEKFVPLVRIPGGWFRMGTDSYDTNTSSERNNNEQYAHWVGLSGFWMGKYEITQQEWQRIMTSNPSSFQSGAASGETQNRRPVENISWYEALIFCNRLSVAEELEPVYSMKVAAGTNQMTVNPSAWGPIPTADNAEWNAVVVSPTANGYRLPTEAQWEYACRGYQEDGSNGVNGKATYAFSWNGSSWNDSYGWARTNSGNITHEVGKKMPTYHPWQLCDMHGNVAEWVFDFVGYDNNDNAIAQFVNNAYRNSDPVGVAGNYNFYSVRTLSYTAGSMSGTVYNPPTYTLADQRSVNLQGLPYEGKSASNTTFKYRFHLARGGAYDTYTAYNSSYPQSYGLKLRSAARHLGSPTTGGTTYSNTYPYLGHEKKSNVGLRVVRPY